jgi:hypothetical protein
MSVDTDWFQSHRGDRLACCPSDPIGWKRTQWTHHKSVERSVKSFQAFTVEMFHEPRSEAKPGDVVGVCVRGQPTAPFYAYPNGALPPMRSRATCNPHETHTWQVR